MLRNGFRNATIAMSVFHEWSSRQYDYWTRGLGKLLNSRWSQENTCEKGWNTLFWAIAGEVFWSHIYSRTTLKLLNRESTLTNYHKLLTQALRLGYLWIDALCSFQDSPDDWQVESKMMHNVYRGSYVNISAPVYKNSNEGLFRSRPPISSQFENPFLNPWFHITCDVYSFFETLVLWKSKLLNVKKELTPKDSQWWNAIRYTYLKDSQDGILSAVPAYWLPIFGPLSQRAWVFRKRHLHERNSTIVSTGDILQEQRMFP